MIFLQKIDPVNELLILERTRYRFILNVLMRDYRQSQLGISAFERCKIRINPFCDRLEFQKNDENSLARYNKCPSNEKERTVQTEG